MWFPGNPANKGFPSERSQEPTMPKEMLMRALDLGGSVGEASLRVNGRFTYKWELHHVYLVWNDTGDWEE